MAPNLPGALQSALIVVEEPELRDVLTRLLEERGYCAKSVPRLDEVRDRREIGAAAVVLIDGEHAPGRVQRLLESIAERVDAPPLVLISDSEDLEEIAELYGVGYLRKPFGVFALMHELEEAQLRGRRPSQRRQRVARAVG